MPLSDRLAEYVRACFTALWIESHEHEDALAELAALCRREDWQLAVWDIEQGFHPGSGRDESLPTTSGDPLAAVRAASTLAMPDGTSLLVLLNFHRYLGSPEIVQAVSRQILEGKQRRTFLVVLSPLVELPPELERQFVILEHEPPDRDQLESLVRSIATEPGELLEEDLPAVLDAAAGLTRYEAEGAFSLSLVRESTVKPAAIWELKAQTLRKHGLLKLHRGGERFESLGGLDSLKAFCTRALSHRSDDPAVRPRGVLLLGVSGSGKSQFAKSLGAESGRPVLSLDVGQLMGSLVGETERNVRQALATAEPRVSFDAGPDGLLIQSLVGQQAVEYRLEGEFPALSFSLPFGELPPVTDRGEITFAVSGNRLEISWNDGRKSHPLLPSVADQLALPADLRVQRAGCLTALADASATTDSASIRYALSCLQLRGDQGQIVATDGLQLLVQSGFDFPWTGDLLVPGSKVFAAKELDRQAPIAIGCTEDVVVLRTGPWTFWLPIETQGRFPKVDAVIPQVTDETPAAELTADDRQFLLSRLKELPGSGDSQSSVTLDLNGEVIIRARATPETPVKEVVLTNSRWTGPPLRIGSRRTFLARAVQLGFDRLVLPDVHGPASCRDARRTYVWAVLDGAAALPPGEASIRIESPTPSLRHLAGATAERDIAPVAPVGLSDLIQEGEQLQRQLRALQGDVRRLVTGLRSQRPRSRRRRVSVPV